MPTVAETPWGHWGSPSPQPAWNEDGPPQLYGSVGGELRPGYADTLKWYYRRAKSSQDKEYCLKLLTKLELQKNSERQQHRSKPKRPQTAPIAIVAETKPFEKSKTPTPPQEKPKKQKAEEKKKESKTTTYQQQLAISQRLSRPKTVKYSLEEKTSTTETLRSRPKSAMADLGRRRVTDPYLTSHKSDFPGYPTGLYAEAVRPMTAQGAINPKTQTRSKIGPTTHNLHYSWKPTTRVEPIRSGSSSGTRNNNPHPDHNFMVWRLPKANAKGQSTAPAKNLGYRTLTGKVMSEILQDKMKSTYQNDFLGIPQGFQMKDAIDAPPDWRESLIRPLDTTSRITYNNCPQEPELMGNTTRYGCNKGKKFSALGIVPSVTRDHVKNQDVIKSRTTYENFFESTYRKPDLDKLLKQQDNKKAVNSFLKYARSYNQDDANAAERTM